MKKVYVSPEIEELMAETQELMQSSLDVNYDTEVGEDDIKSRELFQIFEF